MSKQKINYVFKLLDDFPENKISSLIDYIEFLKGSYKSNIVKQEKDLSNDYQGSESGP